MQYPFLAAVPLQDKVCLWAKDKFDMEQMKGASPLMVHLKSCHHPYHLQYPLSREAEEGIAAIHATLVSKGVVIPCEAYPVSSPIFPVLKSSGVWLFLQDLRLVIDSAFPCTPIVPKPTRILSSLPPNGAWFSVTVLANAFFSIPVDPVLQYCLPLPPMGSDGHGQ